MSRARFIDESTKKDVFLYNSEYRTYRCTLCNNTTRKINCYNMYEIVDHWIAWHEDLKIISI